MLIMSEFFHFVDLSLVLDFFHVMEYKSWFCKCAHWNTSGMKKKAFPLIFYNYYHYVTKNDGRLIMKTLTFYFCGVFYFLTGHWDIYQPFQNNCNNCEMQIVNNWTYRQPFRIIFFFYESTILLGLEYNIWHTKYVK
jgi:hypothetical protein